MTETDHRYALYTVEQVRALDRHAIDVLGIPGFELMRCSAAAGLASLDAMVSVHDQQVHEQPEPSTVVLLGVGGSLAGLVYRRRSRQPKPAVA